MNELHLFAGAGGGVLGGQLLGHRTVCAVEIEPYPRSVLVARQNDGTFPPFPIWDDVRTFDGKPWRGIVDVVAGGFPCQDISVAGKGAGLDGARSGLWSEFARIIGEVRPRIAFIENSPALLARGLDRVLCDLTALGYDAKWGVVSAADVGAPHKRERLWIYATDTSIERCDDGVSDWQKRCLLHHEHGNAAQGERERLGRVCGAGTACSNVANTMRQGRQGGEGQQQTTGQPRLRSGTRPNQEQDICATGSNWAAEPGLGRVVDGMANRAHRLKAIGNGQVPLCAVTAFTILMNAFNLDTKIKAY